MSRLLPSVIAVLSFSSAAVLSQRSASAADYYVSPLGSDAATGSLQAPFRTISRGVAAAMPGDTVHVRGGRYVGWQNQINPIRAGRADAWITFKAYDGELPILSPPADATEASAFEPFDDPEDAFDDVPIAFIRVEGFVAYRWPTSGFSNGWEKHANNIEVRHCIADGNGVNGLTFYDATGVVFEHNIAAHNGNLAPSYSSGVNLYRVQGGPAVNIVRGNVSFENIDVCGNNTPCNAALSSDGSGFILDENGQGVRFESNLGFRNGGSCLRMTLTPGAQLVNNTCYGNGLDTGYAFNFGEIFFSDAMSRNDIMVRNNIAVGTNGQNVINDTNGQNANVGNNAFAPTSAAVFRDPTGDHPDFRLSNTAGALVNGADASATGSVDLGFDPGCIVRAASPIEGVSFWQYAINYEYIASLGGVAGCFRPVARASGGGADMGAYESTELTGANACQFNSDCPDDGDSCTRELCTAEGQCTAEALAECCASAADCDDADACTTDTCSASGACSNEPIGGCSSGGNVDGAPLEPNGTDASGSNGGGASTGSTDTPGDTMTPGNADTPGSTPGGAAVPGASEPASKSSGGCALTGASSSSPFGVLAALAMLLGLRWRRRARVSVGALALASSALGGCSSGDPAPAPGPIEPFGSAASGGSSSNGGSSADPDDGNAATAGTDGATGVAGQGGSSAQGDPGTPNGGASTSPPPINPNAVPSGPAQACTGTPAAEDGLLIDFGTYDFATGQWGDDANGQLTGGTSPYSCADDGSCAAAAALELSLTDAGGMRFASTLPAGGYNGVVLWFGPCIDAAAFEGLQFMASGSLGGAVLLFKVQTNRNYPVDVANTKGACEYRDELTKWSECVPPAVRLSTMGASPALIDLGWGEFGEGLPSASVTPDGLVGLELQFQCQAGNACAIDVTLGTVVLKAPPFSF